MAEKTKISDPLSDLCSLCLFAYRGEVTLLDSLLHVFELMKGGNFRTDLSDYLDFVLQIYAHLNTGHIVQSKIHGTPTFKSNFV